MKLLPLIQKLEKKLENKDGFFEVEIELGINHFFIVQGYFYREFEETEKGIYGKISYQNLELETAFIDEGGDETPLTREQINEIENYFNS